MSFSSLVKKKKKKKQSLELKYWKFEMTVTLISKVGTKIENLNLLKSALTRLSLQSRSRLRKAKTWPSCDSPVKTLYMVWIGRVEATSMVNHNFVTYLNIKIYVSASASTTFDKQSFMFYIRSKDYFSSKVYCFSNFLSLNFENPIYLSMSS